MAIEFNPHNLRSMCKLMDEHGDSETMFFGINEDEEDVQISIFHEKIVVVTMQHNGWIRKNIYWRDGIREETFNGKWK